IGTFTNSGTLAVSGVATRSATTANVDSGSALTIGKSIAGGIVNNGPGSGIDTVTSATISGNGSNAAVIVIASGVATPMTIGRDTVDVFNSGYSFINRGLITAQPVDSNKNTLAMLISGGTSAHVTFAGGLFNSGMLSATTTNADVGTATSATATSATALQIGSEVTIPKIYISAQSTTLNSSFGTIAASVNGPMGGVATAIAIGGTATSVPEIFIEKGGRVVATAAVTDPTNKNVTTLAAIAIQDTSDSLRTLTNQGTITAQVTTLTNGQTAIARAVDVSLTAGGLTFVNNGAVLGDVLFGSGVDSYTISGTPTSFAIHTGAINFGFSGTGVDMLHVAQFANVAGPITAQGTLDVQIDGTGTLTVQNVGTTLATRNFSVAGGTTTANSGTLNITVAQGSGIPVITASQTATLGTNANLSVRYGSFITAGDTFTLISAPTGGGLAVSDADVARYNNQIGGAATPFLFSTATIQRVNNVAGQDILRLTVAPKTAAELGLTGYGNAMFANANIAVSHDNDLGAAMVSGINSPADAQAAYDAFAPDVSGGTRAIAISLTDQGSGVVAARQRALRLFGKQQGDLTLWGNEFGEYISTKGGTVTDPLNPGPVNGFKDHGFGFSLGIDEGSANSGWYGAAFTFYTGDIAEGGDRVSKTSTLWYLLTGYTDWRGKGLFFDSQLTVGYGNLKGKRFIDLTLPTPAPGTSFVREADSKRAALMAALGFTLGANLKYGGLNIIPQLSVDGLTMR
ncbi:MAG TPA: hypothetical protein VGC36_07980, partial [Rhizomicrobium sp.]